MNSDPIRLPLLDHGATLALGASIGRAAQTGCTIALEGDLGAGKTTLVRGIAEGLGIPGPVSSPTYTLMQLHEGGRLPLAHFDAWMEGREKALLADGGDEWLGAEGVAVVEWASNVADWLPGGRLEVELVYAPPTGAIAGGREAILKGTDAPHRTLLGHVLRALGTP